MVAGHCRPTEPAVFAQWPFTERPHPVPPPPRTSVRVERPAGLSEVTWHSLSFQDKEQVPRRWQNLWGKGTRRGPSLGLLLGPGTHTDCRTGTLPRHSKGWALLSWTGCPCCPRPLSTPTLINVGRLSASVPSPAQDLSSGAGCGSRGREGLAGPPGAWLRLSLC